MRRAQFMQVCFLYLGALLLVHFAIAAWVEFTVYTLVFLLGSLTFFAFYVDNRRSDEEVVWPRTVVYFVALLAVAYTVGFVALLLSTFAWN